MKFFDISGKLIFANGQVLETLQEQVFANEVISNISQEFVFANDQIFFFFQYLFDKKGYKMHQNGKNINETNFCKLIFVIFCHQTTTYEFHPTNFDSSLLSMKGEIYISLSVSDSLPWTFSNESLIARRSDIMKQIQIL